jgi:hypothetical protein
MIDPSREMLRVTAFVVQGYKMTKSPAPAVSVEPTAGAAS